MGSTDKTEPVLMRRAAWGVTLFLVQICLVGGIPTPLKNMSSSVGDDEIPNWMESHKIPWFQTTNQLFFEFFWGMTHRFTICFSGLLKGYSMFDIQHGRLVLRRRPHCHFDLLHFAWEKSRFFEWIPETLQKQMQETYLKCHSSIHHRKILWKRHAFWLVKMANTMKP